MTDGHPLPSVLIVDDHPMIRRACEQALSAVARVETAEGGHQALDWMERRVFDVVVLDLQMPTFSGMSTLAVIQERFPGMTGRVVVMTGALSVEEEAHLLKIGVSWIRKPMSLGDLQALVADSAGTLP